MEIEDPLQLNKVNPEAPQNQYIRKDLNWAFNYLPEVNRVNRMRMISRLTQIIRNCVWPYPVGIFWAEVIPKNELLIIN